MASHFEPYQNFPMLVIGLVGPIGSDLDYIEQCISDSLNGFKYTNIPIKLTEIMTELKCGLVIDDTSFERTYQTKIEYANALRKKYRNDILGAIAVSAIKSVDPKRRAPNNDKSGDAYVIRQLKTPEEVALLRSVYGKLFIQISAYASDEQRLERISAKIRIHSKGTIDEHTATSLARSLISRDQKEDEEYGQNLRSVFPLGDVFINSGEKSEASAQLGRFFCALFGSNEVSPTREEYGMYLAKSASLRSSDLSRQVGAAIFSKSGDIVSLGSNEVPKAGGGTYWTGESPDARDFQKGYDPNEINKISVFSDLIKRMAEDGLLNSHLMSMGNPQLIVDNILSTGGGKKYKDSRVMDIIEFGRIIHAEMSAICDASRNGTAIKDGTLYCTTFPCHICAKHIVASGIATVVYLEPYPKSYAIKLHGDSITLSGVESNKVVFRPFIGIAPLRYRDLFEKGKRKSSSGEAKKWESEPRRPLINNLFSATEKAEQWVVVRLAEIIKSKTNTEPDQ